SRLRYALLYSSPRCPSVLSFFFFFHLSVPPRLLHSFPTRRSSDLIAASVMVIGFIMLVFQQSSGYPGTTFPTTLSEILKGITTLDRKSTRLNSSHVSISYAVFCLKKKKKERQSTRNRLCSSQ